MTSNANNPLIPYEQALGGGEKEELALNRMRSQAEPGPEPGLSMGKAEGEGGKREKRTAQRINRKKTNFGKNAQCIMESPLGT